MISAFFYCFYCLFSKIEFLRNRNNSMLNNLTLKNIFKQ